MLDGIGYVLCFVCVPACLIMAWDRVEHDKDRPAMHSGATPETPAWKPDEEMMLYVYEQKQNTLPPTFIP